MTNSVSSQSFSIFQNTVVPTASVSPASQTITCVSGSATFTGTALNPSANIVQNWYSSTYPNGPVSSTSSFSLSIYNIMIPGTHTLEVCNLINGCCITKTVSVISNSGFPSFNPSSTTNYLLGCAPQNQTTLCISNAVSTSGPTQYAFLPPGSFSSVPLPTSAFGAQSCTTSISPGTWTLVVQDPINGCQSAIPVIINQNTTAPNVSYAINTKTITCFTPTILATGSSSTTNTQISWIVPATPSIITNPTVIVGAPNGPTTSPTSTVYANYTVVATNTLNSCKTNSVIIVNQNFRAPTPLLALGNPSVLNCTDTVVVISFTNNASNSGIPGTYCIVDSWMGPAQPTSTVPSPSHNATVAGVYTITVHDTYNGCTGIKTIYVPSNNQGCVGIEKNYLSDSDIRIFPNPAKNYLIIETELVFQDITFEIFDAQGKSVYSKAACIPSQAIHLNVAQGFYFYQLSENGKMVKRSKLIIE